MSGGRTGPTLRIGTRGSKLALVQAAMVRDALLARHPGLTATLEVISTRGDVVLDRPLSSFGDKGVFVDAIEEALRQGRVDLAVHSAKDLPSSLAADMTLAAFLPRADPRDVLVAAPGSTLGTLPAGARVGTSSLRRACQVRALRPDLQLHDIRGNVDTRLRKLQAGDYDAILLAAAGLDRLGLTDQIAEYLDPAVMLPAVGQGALAVEVRAADLATAACLAALDDPATRAAVTAERAFLARIGGGCKLPAAAYATLEGNTLCLRGLIGAADGRTVGGARTGTTAAATALGTELADELLARGGATLLESLSAPGPTGAGAAAPAAVLPGTAGRVGAAARPLAGRRIVVTRAHDQSGPLVARLQALGAEVVECPAIRIAPPADYAPLDAALADLACYRWLLFTSANGVHAFFARRAGLATPPADLTSRPPSPRGKGETLISPPRYGEGLGERSLLPAHLRVGAIGPATAAALAVYGVVADFVPDTYIAEAVVAQIGDVAGARVLLPRADLARPALAEGLQAKGAAVTQVLAYRTVPGAGDLRVATLLAAGQVAAVTFTSSSTVRFFLDLLAGAGPEGGAARAALAYTPIVCIGPITAATAREHGLPVAAVAAEYTTDGLVAAVQDLLAPLPPRRDQP